MKNVLICGLTPPLEGGSERHIYEISKRIVNSEVLTQKGSICKNKIELQVLNISSFLRSISFFFSCLAYSFSLILAEKKYETVHIHENLLYFLVPLLRLRYNVVVTVHGVEGFRFYDNKLLWLFFRTALRFANKIIAVSPQDKKLLDYYFENKKVSYIPNGVDLSAYKDVNVKVENKIVFIGRIHEQKGIVYLLEAFEKFSMKHADFRLEIIGEINDYAKELQRKFCSDKIIWKGYISERKKIVKTLKSARCIVLPSVWEGLPLTLFEAMASERPVIVSDIPAYRAVINNEVIFFKAQNSKDLENKMDFVLKNREKSSIMGKKGRKLAERYDWNKIAGDIEKILT